MSARSLARAAAAAVLVACSATPPAPSSANGGSSQSTSSGGTAGGSGQTGAGGGGGAGGSLSSAGASGATAGSAGTPSSAGAGGSGGSGGASGGTAGTEPTAGAGGNSSVATPSEGCGNGGRPSGGTVTVQGDHIYDFPEKYDGTTPLPMLLGLHANGNPYTQIQSLTNGSKLATDYVRVFPKSAGSGWVLNTDGARVDTIFDDVLSNYCVDTSRIFVTGHSSGAQMAVQMLCAGDTRFKAAAPVAASKYCQEIEPIPVMYIQGMMDAQRGGGNGIDVVNFFASSNSCSAGTMPYGAVAGCNSSFDQQPVDPGCVTYEGCSAPTIWCSHNDNGYNSTDGRMHGWPCFASSAMADFFESLP